MKMSKKIEPLFLERLEAADLDSVMALQDKINSVLDNKEIYVSSTREEFQKAIEETGYLLGYKTKEGQLIGLGVYISYDYNEHNYGYDLAFKGEKLLKTGQVDTVIVDPDFRGNGLQKKLCMALEEFAKNQGKAYLMATVSPLNPYSLNNFLALGYEIKKEKLKYGGLRRYILCKSLI